MKNNKSQFSKLNSLDSLKEFCNQNISDILSGNLNTLDSPIKVRFIDFDTKFGVTGLGRFFFVDDCMYMITMDRKYEKDHNPDIALFFGDEEAYLNFLASGRFIVRVIFAGIYTGFIDDKGNRIFTGDVVKALVFPNPDFPSKRGSHRAKNKNTDDKGSQCEAGVSDCFDDFSMIFDNHRAPLSWASKIKVIGSLFFSLEKGTTEVNIQELCNEFAQARDRDTYKELIKKSPYFPPSNWQEEVLEMLGVNDD